MKKGFNKDIQHEAIANILYCAGFTLLTMFVSNNAGANGEKQRDILLNKEQIILSQADHSEREDLLPHSYEPRGYLERWCGRGGELGSRHFGEFIGIRTQQFTETYFAEVSKKAFYYPDPIQPGDVYFSTDIQLLLLKYLRNYIYAVHGHQFKDLELAKCFHNVRKDDRWNSIEKSNAANIQNHERMLKARQTGLYSAQDRHIYVKDTNWKVEVAENGRNGDYHTVPWSFSEDGTVHAGNLWRGVWQPISSDTIRVVIMHQNTATDQFDVQFFGPNNFTAYKNGVAYRYGVRE